MENNRIAKLVNTIVNAASWEEVRSEVREFCQIYCGENFDWNVEHGYNLRQIFERSLAIAFYGANMYLLNDEFTEKTDFLVLCDYRNNVLEKMPKSENYEGIGR